jgi:hypothetical protein
MSIWEFANKATQLDCTSALGIADMTSGKGRGYERMHHTVMCIAHLTSLAVSQEVLLG